MARPPQRRRQKGGPSRSPGRRTPPPAATGLEASYFETAQREQEPLVVVLADGRRVSGIVQEVDRDLLTLAVDTGEVLIRKSEIRYVYEAAEER